jgi:hypothetical protein
MTGLAGARIGLSCDARNAQGRGEIIFANGSFLEQRMAGLLREWRLPSTVDDADFDAPEGELAGLAERLLSDVFQYFATGRASDYWCDGVTVVDVRVIGPDSYKVLGAACWAERPDPAGPFYLAPVEFEFHGVAGERIERTIVRFGALDRFGEIKRHPLDSTPQTLVDRRPQENVDWAVALELT